MQELFDIKKELNPFLDEFVKELVDKVSSQVEEGKYSRQELNALMEIIRGNLSSLIGYELGVKLHWLANDL